jgi:hypothetical protein
LAQRERALYNGSTCSGGEAGQGYWGNVGLELFLDIELQPSDIERIVTVLDDSPYSLRELEAILEREVYPACEANMRCPAGEWVAFDLDWLEQQVLTPRPRRSGWPTRLQLGWWILRRQWRPIWK